LGSLLFLIYINDLLYGIYHTVKPVLYVGDTSLLNTAKSKITNKSQDYTG
jgi:hypothetical protein